MHLSTTFITAILGSGLSTYALPQAGGVAIGDAGQLAGLIGQLVDASSDADAVVTVYSDENCQTPISVHTVKGPASCDIGFDVGFSSMKLAAGTGGGTLTAYTKNNCGCPTCGSHGYYGNGGDDCLQAFGFVANALGWSSLV